MLQITLYSYPHSIPSDSTASIERPVYNKDNNGLPRLMYQGKPFDRDDFTDSQFDMLPTQYSSQDNENESRSFEETG